MSEHDSPAVVLEVKLTGQVPRQAPPPGETDPIADAVIRILTSDLPRDLREIYDLETTVTVRAVRYGSLSVFVAVMLSGYVLMSRYKAFIESALLIREHTSTLLARLEESFSGINTSVQVRRPRIDDSGGRWWRHFWFDIAHEEPPWWWGVTSGAPAPPDPQDREYVAAQQAWRERVWAAKAQAGGDLDKVITTLSGAILAYTASVRSQLVAGATPNDLMLLKGAWASLAIAVIAVAVSSYATWRAHELADEQGPEYDEAGFNVTELLIPHANAVMLLSFVAGVILLVAFAWSTI